MATVVSPPRVFSSFLFPPPQQQSQLKQPAQQQLRQHSDSEHFRHFQQEHLGHLGFPKQLQHLNMGQQQPTQLGFLQQEKHPCKDGHSHLQQHPHSPQAQLGLGHEGHFGLHSLKLQHPLDSSRRRISCQIFLRRDLVVVFSMSCINR